MRQNPSSSPSIMTALEEGFHRENICLIRRRDLSLLGTRVRVDGVVETHVHD